MRKRLVVAVLVGAVCALAVAVGAVAQSAPETPVARSGPGTFQVVGTVDHRLVLNTAVLALLPQRTLDVQFRSGSTVEQHTFTGPLLRDVIGLAGPQFDPAVKNDKLRHYVTATGSDGYQALVAWGEIDADFENKPVLLAVTQDGQSLADTGPRLVVPGDDRGGRYVSGVVRVRLGLGR